MTRKKQLLYITGLFLVFLILIPVIILYSMGYRLSSDFRIVETGGIYFYEIKTNASVFMNGKLAKTSGILDRSLLVQNIKPGQYYVKIVKDGFHAWEKQIKVMEKEVEVCYPLIVPEKLEPVEIKKYISVADNSVPGKKGKKTKWVLNDEYGEISGRFKTSWKPADNMFTRWYGKDKIKLKLGRFRKLRDKVLLTKEGNNLYVQWIGKKNQLPFFINTMKKKIVYSPKGTITAFDFYPDRDDSFIVRSDDGSLDAVELDTRFGGQNFYKILRYCDRFIVESETLFYTIGERIFYIDLNI